MKKLIKDNLKVLVAFTLGAILFSGITYVLATGMGSDSLEYLTGKNNNVETVEDALDDLYNQIIDHPVTCYNGTCGRLSYRYWNDNLSSTLYSSNQMPSDNYATRSALETAYGSSNFASRSFYIRSVLINGNVVGHESCLWNTSTNKEFCFAPNYWAGTVGVEDSVAGAQTIVMLRRDIQNALEVSINTSNCSSHGTSAYCTVGSYYCYSDYAGRVWCRDNSLGCLVNSNGSAYCG